ncbi:NAD-dependent protein deacetylase [Salinispira pacifica]|nr:NAD-dependent protein deacetylase [Salinispira pacifica]
MKDLYGRLAEGLITVLSGAGISTDSGIPDYRGEDRTRARKHDGDSGPVTYKQFMGSADKRRHYWARSALGWPWIRSREPNRAHRILSRLEEAEHINGIITQNVDDLHFKAGSRNVIELHGNLKQVKCMGCGGMSSRDELQERMLLDNPPWKRLSSDYSPDGDALLSEDVTREFRTPGCPACGGILKPDVVFFGENVPRTRVQSCYALVDECDLLLVLGSSLAVRSGLRFVEHAKNTGKPVIIVNRGTTRGDASADLKVDTSITQWLETHLAEPEISPRA